MSSETEGSGAQLLRASEVVQILGISMRHFQRLVDSGVAPEGMRLGKRAKRWARSEIEKWIAGGCKREGSK